MRRMIALLTLVGSLIVLWCCSGDVILNMATGLAGTYSGSYSVTVDYGTIDSRTYVQPIMWYFTDSTYIMRIDTTRPFDSTFNLCRVDGHYNLDGGLNLYELHFYPDVPSTSCAEKNNPRGEFALIKSSRGDSLRMSQYDLEYNLFKEISVMRDTTP